MLRGYLELLDGRKNKTAQNIPASRKTIEDGHWGDWARVVGGGQVIEQIRTLRISRPGRDRVRRFLS